jgi:hypothetical protein
MDFPTIPLNSVCLGRADQQAPEFFEVDTMPAVRPVRSNFPARIAFFCNPWASARDIDLTGPQAELAINATQGS